YLDLQRFKEANDLIPRIFREELEDSGRGGGLCIRAAEALIGLYMMQDRYDEALATAKEALNFEDNVQIFLGEDRAPLRILKILPELYRFLGRGEDQVNIARKIWQLCIEEFGELDPDSIHTTELFIRALRYTGQLEEAESTARDALHTLQRIGESNSKLIIT